MRMSDELIFGLYIFVLATFVGYQVISRVPPLLHTPLMSGTNAISGISLVGVARRGRVEHNHISQILGFVAVTCATHQRRRRLHHHRPHAPHVQGEGARRAARPSVAAAKGRRRDAPTSSSASRTSSRRSSSSCACAGLSSPEAARRGALPRRARHAHRRRRDAAPQARSSPTSGSSAGIVLGAGIGIAISRWIPMTKMPERIALSPRLRRPRHGARRRAPSTCARTHGHVTALQDGRARLRGLPRLPDVHRQHHGVRQAPGLHHRRAGHLEGAELHQHRPLLRRRSSLLVVADRLHPARTTWCSSRSCGDRPGARRHGGPARSAAPTCRSSSRSSTRTPASPRARRASRSRATSSSSPARSTARRGSCSRS